MKQFVLDVPLRWGDMDAMSHLNNTLYFRLMEEARIQWFAQVRISHPADRAKRRSSRTFQCDFLKAMTYPGTAVVTQTVTESAARASRCR